MVVKWRPSARRHINGIKSFYGSRNPRFTAKIINGIFKEVERLTKNPFRCPLSPRLAHTGLGYRYSVVQNWKIIYRADGETIYIFSVFDCRQDPEKITERTEEK